MKSKKCVTCGNSIHAGNKSYCNRTCYNIDKHRKRQIYDQLIIKDYLNKNLDIIDVSQKYKITTTTIYNILKRYKTKPRGAYIDYTNKKIGKSICLKKDKIINNRQGWICLCSCNQQFIATSNRIKSSVNLSCESCRRKASRSKLPLSKYIWGQIYHGRFRAKVIEFNISREYAWNLYLKQNKKCAISGVDIVFAETAVLHKTGHSTASLDRIDSSKGYIEGNVQWVHKTINVMKQAMTDQQLIEWCKIIVDFNLKEKDYVA